MKVRDIIFHQVRRRLSTATRSGPPIPMKLFGERLRACVMGDVTYTMHDPYDAHIPMKLFGKRMRACVMGDVTYAMRGGTYAMRHTMLTYTWAF